MAALKDLKKEYTIPSPSKRLILAGARHEQFGQNR
jgi:hypothetical protein